MTNLDHPEEFHRALSEGAWLLRQNRPQDAMERLLPLWEIAPSNPDVAINLGGAYILQGKWNKAVRVLNRAAELHPENVMIWINLAAAHLGRLELSGPQQQERAIRAYERALAIDPHAPNVHYHLGLIHKDRGDITRAANAFERALAVNPADADAKYWLAWLERQRLAQAAAEAEVQADTNQPVAGAEANDAAGIPDGTTADRTGNQGEQE
jgi:tetratricopeptide (TPR) repeat protein